MNTPRSSATSLKAELVLASDLHIRGASDLRAQLLVDLIDRVEGQTANFVLNGDVFDFCYGRGRYFRQKYAAIGAALERLAARGTRVLFVEGNHEFQMHEAGWRGVEIAQGRDLVLTLPSGGRVKITHGDLLSGDRLYAAFRALVKSKAARIFADVIPGAWLDAYAMRHATISRSRDKYRTLDHGRVLSHFARWLAEEPAVEHGVIGHYHVPYAEPSAAGGLMLSVESWDRPSILVFQEGLFWRADLNAVGAAFEMTPTRPMLA